MILPVYIRDRGGGGRGGCGLSHSQKALSLLTYTLKYISLEDGLRSETIRWTYIPVGFHFVVYYESIKREPKTRPIYECRCDERLTKKFTRLSCTGLVVVQMLIEPASPQWRSGLEEVDKKKMSRK
jgi:hypothetical protein